VATSTSSEPPNRLENPGVAGVHAKMGVPSLVGQPSLRPNGVEHGHSRLWSQRWRAWCSRSQSHALSELRISAGSDRFEQWPVGLAGHGGGAHGDPVVREIGEADHDSLSRSKVRFLSACHEMAYSNPQAILKRTSKSSPPAVTRLSCNYLGIHSSDARANGPKCEGLSPNY
jgi:hypothetical protein